MSPTRRQSRYENGTSAENADMLVVGARGLGGFGGLLLGSVSQHCVHHATNPTVIVRNGGDTPTRRIVVGIDGSDHAYRALVWATDEARRRGAALTVVHGYTVLPIGAYPYSTLTIDPTLMPPRSWPRPAARRPSLPRRRAVGSATGQLAAGAR